MSNPESVTAFQKSIMNKFNVYNSLFLNLPFRKVSNIGMLIPLLQHHCKAGLEMGKEPVEILDSFFDLHPEISKQDGRQDFMFRVIQYVERQIVLFDSVEDTAFTDIQKHLGHLDLEEFIHLLENGHDNAAIIEKLSDFSARIVFTAHPTQFYTPAVLDIISKLRSYIQQNSINDIDLTLQQLGLTSLINSKKPTPLDEAKNIIYFLRNIYYDAIGELYSGIKYSLQAKNFDNPDLIKLGFWPGGDRDGNPFVTAAITLDVADELRMTLMKCYYKDIRQLEQKLTFREVDEVIAILRQNIYNAMFNREQLLNYDDIITPLLKIRELVVQRYNSLYLDSIEQLIDKVNLFRTHFAVLDIRQDHSIHQQVIDNILKHAGLVQKSHTELERTELISILLQGEISVHEDMFEDAVLKDTIRTIKLLPLLQERNGEEGCNRYIISNSEDIFSVLFVYALMRWCTPKNDTLNFDIVPLFETMNGMKNSGNIMKELLEIPEYRSHLHLRREKQTMMLGFSDGTKDGGYLAANWSIFKTKEELSEVCTEYGVKAIFFDGRGGPPARGGGKTHRFYTAQSRKTARHEIQLTIQGQTITSKYGTKEHFKFHFEQLLTAGLSNSFNLKNNELSETDHQLLEDMARLSFEKYTTLKNNACFLPYLQKKSTLKYYGMANIGSRPAKRGSKDKLELSDLRAISFVGSWSQLKQNVPGYYGIGYALRTLADEGKLEDLKKLFQEVPFFKALIMNSMMSLSKSNFSLTSYISRDNEFKEFWNLLYDEFNLSKEMVMAVSGYKQMMDEEPVTRNSIGIREQIVLPLLVIQQYALQKIEKGSEHTAIFEKMVTRSLYGNINASRNSA